MANFRPLQPAPMEEQSPQPQGKPLLTQKPRRTVTLGACVACRKRKSKCDGSRPMCTCCAQKDTACVYELGPNEKPSQAMKRKNEEMQGELSNLRHLYDFLRLRPEQEAMGILRKIRASPSETTSSQRIQDLADFVRHGDLPSPTQPPLYGYPTRQQLEPRHPLTLPSLRLAMDSLSPDSNALPLPSTLALGDEGPASRRRRHASDADVSDRSDSVNSLPKPTSIEALLHPHGLNLMDEVTEPRLSATKNWTAVTNNDQLLARLLTAWHIWEYSYHHFFDWDIFLDDLSTGRTDFCSELLVNAILATASSHSPLVKGRSKPLSDNVMTDFYKEARRLWELGEGQEHLPRLQAALCLFMVLGKHGRDKISYLFLHEACRIAHSLGLFRPGLSNVLKPQHVPEEKWHTARAVTAWALFNFQMSMSVTYSIPTILKSPPSVAIPYNDTPDREAFLRSECARNLIILECLDTFVGIEVLDFQMPLRPELIESLYLRLKDWYETRPGSLDAKRHPSPENLLAAMQHCVYVIRLFQPALESENTEEQIKLYRSRASITTATVIKELRQLIVLHDTRHGFANAIGLVIHPIVVASFGTLEEVALQDLNSIPQEANESYDSLITCLRALGTISSHVFYAQPLFRLLTQTCQTLNIPLPQEISSILHLYQSEEWTRIAANVVSSQYIADTSHLTSAVKSARMDAIISGWDALNLDSPSPSASETAL